MVMTDTWLSQSCISREREAASCAASQWWCLRNTTREAPTYLADSEQPNEERREVRYQRGQEAVQSSTACQRPASESAARTSVTDSQKLTGTACSCRLWDDKLSRQQLACLSNPAHEREFASVTGWLEHQPSSSGLFSFLEAGAQPCSCTSALPLRIDPNPRICRGEQDQIT